MSIHIPASNVRRVGALTGAMLLAVGMAACSASPSATPSTATTAESGEAASTCGSVPVLEPKDTDGVLAEFDEATVANYNGYSQPIQASAWAEWAPEGAGPYTAALVTTPPSNPFQVTMVGALREGLEEQGIEVIFDQAAAGFADVPQQLALLDQAVALEPDIILFQPLASGPAVDAVNAAGEAGIPVVGIFNAIDSAYAVNVAFNNTAQAAIIAAGVLEEAGGAGTVLTVTGIPGIQQDTDARAGSDAALALCPDVEVVGEVAGNYQNSLAQSAVLQFLATNPAGVDMVLQSGTMGLGVLQAFLQSGREPALIGDIGSSRGFIAYAHENPDAPYFGTSGPDEAIGATMADVAARILAGQGPKINQLIKTPLIITNDNLADAYVDGWALDDSTNAALEGDEFLAGAELDVFFNNPELTLAD